ncbi:aldo/keto reductase [Aureliella helgolandensis]|uniref:General stress protein 69 n=1 Tax=Aureliella helgolandensis TaxID=2527968 RepID=A0A518G4M2_9BACT|nr:aldo/keto reductase [Aureliella helgolandensis]QDV23500.1 General stress protein 69 [Aureliella helgolandensis]
MSTLEQRQLGKTGLCVTRLGYGSMGLRGPNTWGIRTVSDEAAERVLHAVLDAGVNFIDTSPDYGVSEARIGRFLSSRRGEFTLATKCGCDPIQHADTLEIRHTWTADTVRRNLETSLERLQTDHIDLLQFHGGDAATLKQNGLIEVLQGFREQGTVRALGVSTKLPEITDLLKLEIFDAFQLPYACVAPEHAACMDEAARQGAGVIVRGGIAQGGPDAEIQRPAVNAVWAAAKLDELLPASMSRAEFILRYTLSHPHCDTAIVGTCNLEHFAENVAAAKAGALPGDLYAEITRRVQEITGAGRES